jgi:hypothetical protein
MDECFEKDYKEGVVKWSKILGDFHKRIPRRFKVSLFMKIQEFQHLPWHYHHTHTHTHIYIYIYIYKEGKV